VSQPTFGVSFSSKQCRNFGINAGETLAWLIKEAGFRRFRLMSYWDEHEKKPGEYDFASLDTQMDQIAAAGGEVTLALGARQPRWPENHWPNWAWDAPKAERTKALLKYLQIVVERYKNHPALVSYQLENEALLEAFGRRPEVDVPRLKAEYALIKRLDPHHPVIMSTSHHWGIPWRPPIPDIVGFSYYFRVHAGGGTYKSAYHFMPLHIVRAVLIRVLKNRPTFIHELQLEPWGPTAIWKMTAEVQDDSMGPAQITHNVKKARQTRLSPIDLWGGEWWYWRLHKQHDASTWEAVKAALGPTHFITSPK
jgi:hypothetical protein